MLIKGSLVFIEPTLHVSLPFLRLEDLMTRWHLATRMNAPNSSSSGEQSLPPPPLWIWGGVWGRFYHQWLRRILSTAGMLVNKLSGIRRGSTASFYPQLLVGFGVSALIHMIGAMVGSFDDGGFGQAMFFLVQPLGIVVEESVIQIGKRLGIQKSGESRSFQPKAIPKWLVQVLRKPLVTYGLHFGCGILCDGWLPSYRSSGSMMTGRRALLIISSGWLSTSCEYCKGDLYRLLGPVSLSIHVIFQSAAASMTLPIGYAAESLTCRRASNVHLQVTQPLTIVVLTPFLLFLPRPD